MMVEHFLAYTVFFVMTEFTLSRRYGPLVNLLMYYVLIYITGNSVYQSGLAAADNFTTNILLISICNFLIILIGISINRLKYHATPTFFAPLTLVLNERIKWAVFISTVTIIATTGWK